MMFVLVNLQSSDGEKKSLLITCTADKSYHKGEHERKMCRGTENTIASKETNKETTACAIVQ